MRTDSEQFRYIELASLAEIERLLLRLGRRNHLDNMKALSGFPYFYHVELSEQEFMGLVFLQNDEVSSIAPRGHDRRLQAVARRALILGDVRLSDNWDLGQIRERLVALGPAHPGFRLESLILRDSRGNERHYGPWYLQDGSHRGLAYAMMVIEGQAPYQTQTAYCATERLFTQPQP